MVHLSATELYCSFIFVVDTSASSGGKQQQSDSDLPSEYLNSELYKQSQREPKEQKPAG